jgi:iron complex transport system ATP-binding protein
MGFGMSDNGSKRPSIVALEDVSVRRSGKTILSGISWVAEPGHHWALLGANGSGKTTLLKVITGYEWASSGSVTVLGSRFGECNIPLLRRTIGWVSSALQEKVPPSDNALEVVASGHDASLGVYRDLSEQEFRAAWEMLEWLEIQGLSDRPYGILSQGERQRILIARALVSRPRLLILDEPCAGLDPRATRQFLDDLARLVARPEAPAILFVTHHVEEIGPWIDRVLVLKDGKVAAQGDKDRVLTAEVLGKAFDCPCRVGCEDGHYWLRLQSGPAPAQLFSPR